MKKATFLLILLASCGSESSPSGKYKCALPDGGYTMYTTEQLGGTCGDLGTLTGFFDEGLMRINPGYGATVTFNQDSKTCTYTTIITASSESLPVLEMVIELDESLEGTLAYSLVYEDEATGHFECYSEYIIT